MIFEAFKRMREERPGDPAFLVASGDRSLPINWRQFTDDATLLAQLALERLGPSRESDRRRCSLLGRLVGRAAL